MNLIDWFLNRHLEEDKARLLDLIQTEPLALAGYDMHKRTGIRSGRLFPALYALEDDGLIVGEFDDSKPRRRRRYYLVAR